MDIIITNLQSAIAIPTAHIKKVVSKSAFQLKLKFPELSIVFVGSRRMRAINNQFLGHDYVTDVITFEHGEIVVCPSVAVRNAKHFNNPVKQELLLYVVHGLLHLAGYDDHTPKDIQRMRHMENTLLGE